MHRRASARTTSVAVIDDDLITRSGIAALLAGRADVGVDATGTLVEAETWTVDRWAGIDWAIIDIHDHGREVSETGTDIFTGIGVIRSVRKVEPRVRTIAITPTVRNPLLAARLADSGVDHVFERWEFAEQVDLIDALQRPCPSTAPARHPEYVLRAEGLLPRARPNQAMDLFRASPLYGRLSADRTQAAIGPRRAALTLRDAVAATGFIGTGAKPRWNEVRDYLLKLSGRLPVTPAQPKATSRSRRSAR